VVARIGGTSEVIGAEPLTAAPELSSAPRVSRVACRYRLISWSAC